MTDNRSGGRIHHAAAALRGFGPRLLVPEGRLIGLLLLLAFAFSAGEVVAGGWQPLATRPPLPADADLAYAEASVQRLGDGVRIDAHLAFFQSRAYRLAVVDLGSIEPQRKPKQEQRIAAAFRAAGVPAGVNGGFFHPDGSPLGLVIADGKRINRLERAKLLSAVLYSDPAGNYLVRFANFRDQPDIQALLQTGPYLIDHARAVRGLSGAKAARRSFVATDWRGHWVLGSTLTMISLADLADCLASTGALTDWPVERAVNLDGGTSTGFFFAGNQQQGEIVIEPRKPVRNLLGIVPR